MAKDQPAFEQFMKQREKAAEAYVRGDPGPVDRLAARTSPATFFGPMGGHVRGANDVAEKYKGDAAMFGSDGESSFEIFEAAAGDDVAYWTGIQHAKVHIGNRPEATPINLRVTEVFHREGGEWKLVHRHADMLTSEQRPH